MMFELTKAKYIDKKLMFNIIMALSKSTWII